MCGEHNSPLYRRATATLARDSQKRMANFVKVALVPEVLLLMLSIAHLMAADAARELLAANSIETASNSASSTSLVTSPSWDFNAPMYADFAKISKLHSLYDDDSVDESYFSTQPVLQLLSPALSD